jgi:hypothetical protein
VSGRGWNIGRVLSRNFDCLSFTPLWSSSPVLQIILTVGSILAVMKDVDIVFKRRFDIYRLQVLLINSNLVSQAVNVVIGDNLYELKFHVELSLSGSNPQPMEMDDEQGNGGEELRKDVRMKGSEAQHFAGQRSTGEVQPGRGSETSSVGSKGVKLGPLPTYHIEIPSGEGVGHVGASGAVHAA